MKKQIIFTIILVLAFTALAIYLLTQKMIYSGISAIILGCLIIVYQILSTKEKKKQIKLEDINHEEEK